MLSSMVSEYYSRILYQTIPAFLMRMLINFGKKVGALKELQQQPQGKQKVYDLLNCGPRNRFVILGDVPLIAHNCVQSTGHDCLVILIGIYWRLLEKHGIEAYQWGEYHDQVIVEVREDQAEEAARLLDGAALTELNKQLGGLIRLRGDAQVIDNLAEAKNLKPETI
jgi:hypothetical protein